MKKAVMYGAGNIGRGFIGQVFHDSGYEVVFIEVNTAIVDAMNARRSYPLRVVSEKGNREVVIDNVRAVNGMDAEAVANEIASAEIMATAVGVNILPRIAPAIAKGLLRRFSGRQAEPLNIIICENLIDAGSALREMLKPHMGNEAELLQQVGFVEASIGRMVPVMTADMQEGDVLRQWVEPFCELPLDEKAFIGGIPALKYIKPFSPFRFYEERKLYIHNLGHAMTAYMGQMKGYEYIWQAAGDECIRNAAREAMVLSAKALSKAYNVPYGTLEEHIDDLLYRFGNKALGDTVARVGRDPMRKLKPQDRFAGAIARCNAEKIPVEALLRGMAAALYFIREDDPASLEMEQEIKSKGAKAFLIEYSGLGEADAIKCLKYYQDKSSIN